MALGTRQREPSQAALPPPPGSLGGLEAQRGRRGDPAVVGCTGGRWPPGCTLRRGTEPRGASWRGPARRRRRGGSPGLPACDMVSALLSAPQVTVNYYDEEGSAPIDQAGLFLTAIGESARLGSGALSPGPATPLLDIALLPDLVAAASSNQCRRGTGTAPALACCPDARGSLRGAAGLGLPGTHPVTVPCLGSVGHTGERKVPPSLSSLCSPKKSFPLSLSSSNPVLGAQRYSLGSSAHLIQVLHWILGMVRPREVRKLIQSHTAARGPVDFPHPEFSPSHHPALPWVPGPLAREVEPAAQARGGDLPTLLLLTCCGGGVTFTF